MSAFIVRDDTINRILAYITVDRENHYTLREMGLDNPSAEQLSAFGQAMYEMNCAAIDARYGTGEAARWRSDGSVYQYRSILPTSIYQTLKSLDCYLYQCSEGDIPEAALYKQLTDYSIRLMRNIIESLTQYEAANWG